MKKVRRQDLINLIAHYYWAIIDPEHKPINDIIDGHGDIRIDINSIYISVIDFGGLSSISDNQKREFAKALQSVTFGNLQVTYVGRVETHIWIDIANAYEVID